MLSETEQKEINKLISRLNSTDVLDPKRARDLSAEIGKAAFYKMMESGKNYGEAIGGLSFLNKPDTFVYLKSIANNLSRHIEITNETLDFWFSKGEIPPPITPKGLQLFCENENCLM